MRITTISVQEQMTAVLPRIAYDLLVSLLWSFESLMAVVVIWMLFVVLNLQNCEVKLMVFVV